MTTPVSSKRGRGGTLVAVSLQEDMGGEHSRVLDILVLDEVLTRLAVVKPRYSQLVEMRFMGGLTMQEIAEVLSVSIATLEREWNFARLWLRRELGHEIHRNHESGKLCSSLGAKSVVADTT